MIRLMKLLLIGIRIGKLSICIIVYADDTLLLANNKEDMQLLLDEIGKLGNEDDILFNGKKSAILVFNELDTKQDNIKFKLNREIIPIVESTRYLGYQLNVHNNNYAHILQRKNKTYAAVYKLRSSGLISHNVSPTTRAFLFKTFVRPVLHYGIDNSHLDVNDFNLVKKTETSAFKMMLCINKQCHNTTLYKAVSMTQTETKLEKDKLNLYIRLKENVLTNEILNECSKLRIERFTFTLKMNDLNK